MSLNLIFQILDSLSYLIDLPLFGGEKKNRKTKHITQNRIIGGSVAPKTRRIITRILRNPLEP